MQAEKYRRQQTSFIVTTLPRITGRQRSACVFISLPKARQLCFSPLLRIDACQLDLIKRTTRNCEHMAEPIPVYPQVGPRPEAAVDIGHYSRPTSKSAPASILDGAFFQAGRSLRQVRNKSLTALSGMKRTATYVAEERPIHSVLGVAIAAFVVGSGLRIWRSRHE